MKPLENRPWFVLLSLVLAILLMGVWWYATSLSFTLAALGPFTFATIGLWLGIGRGLALVLIRYRPELGVVG